MNYELYIAALCLTLLMACSKGKTTEEPVADNTQVSVIADMIQVTVGEKTYDVANQNDEMHIYRQQVKPDSCFFVISKREFRLYVYEQVGKDTLLVAHFPVCYARYPEAKTKSGDMRTPESTLEKPFTICQIQEATDWCHDFGDGRGSIPSYGDWFMRLETPRFTGVGIHGSTNNEASVPGRDSEGCIRLRDADLRVLHDQFAVVGTPVIISGVQQPKYPFEQKAQVALGDQYVAPTYPRTPEPANTIINPKNNKK